MFYCKKKFGQNFLIDPSIIQSIVNHINPTDDQILIEIGPGEGAITAPLLEQCNKLIAIEIDRDLIPKLNKTFNHQLQNNKFILINQDVLTVDFVELLHLYSQPISGNTSEITKIKIIGNLPYNISTVVLFKLFTLKSFDFNNKLASMSFLLQKEVAERLVACPGNGQYGKLSIMAQYHAKINIVFLVKANAFKPIPKVESAMVEFIPYAIKPVEADDYQHFNQLVTAAFSQRRKTLTNSLRQYCNATDWELLNITPNARAEELSIFDFVKISNFLVKKL